MTDDEMSLVPGCSAVIASYSSAVILCFPLLLLDKLEAAKDIEASPDKPEVENESFPI